MSDERILTADGLHSVTGLMSGTSLDGLDIACCEFREEGGSWGWRILRADTIPYPARWKDLLEEMQFLEGRELIAAHVAYGKFLGESVRMFISDNSLSTQLISSHGHTIFHRPDLGYTFQAGDGAALATASGLPVVCDFRSGDVARGGQGAPLVPLGDRLLFGEYGACLNLGGFANISFERLGKRVAFDICPLNKLLNPLAQLLGLEYDEDGRIAAGGSLLPNLLEALNELEYYHSPPPKSLGEEWLRKYVLPLTNPYRDRVADLMHTLCAHMAGQIASAILAAGEVRVLATGGGAYNRFLVGEINKRLTTPLDIPADEVVQFKEALVFAFLGMLRWQGRPNILASVTGASSGHSAGAIYLP